MTLEPGVLVLLYKTRWEIEKVFDETKTKLQEKKSWGTSTTAKEMQSHFVSIVHNLLLLLLLQDYLQLHGVENTAEIKRRQERLTLQKDQLKQTNQSLHLIYSLLERLTQASFKLIRWLRVHWHRPTSLNHALAQLHHLYARL